MKKVTYRERIFLDKFRAIDTIRTQIFTSYWKPENTSLFYFRVGEYGIFTLSEEDIISIEEES